MNILVKMVSLIARKIIKVNSELNAHIVSVTLRVKCYKRAKIINFILRARDAPNVGTLLVMVKRCLCKVVPLGIQDVDLDQSLELTGKNFFTHTTK